jgi:mitochondrial enoyl-[acyl-carrier protein] reductase / trans-2-enoyl-CoA reductase
MKTLIQTAYGEPARVLELREEPNQLPETGEALIGVEAGVVQMADLHTVFGREGFRKSLPRTPGYDGVGRVLAVGAGVSNVIVGERVLCPVGSGTHREQYCIKADHLTPAPEGDAEQFALLALNPASALLMLEDHVKLSEGDWIIQNAANSGVGRIIQQIATELHLRVVNVVKSPDVAAELGDLRTDIVLIDDKDLVRRVSTTTQGAPIRLALDAVGGSATAELAGCLAEGGTLINHGSMSGEACQITSGILSSREIRLVGFNAARRLARCSAEERKQLYDRLGAWVNSGALRAKIAAIYPIDQAIEAYERVMSLGDKRFGKVVIRMRDWPRPTTAASLTQSPSESSAAPSSQLPPAVASEPSQLT